MESISTRMSFYSRLASLELLAPPGKNSSIFRPVVSIQNIHLFHHILTLVSGIIITALGFLPGYYVTVLTIEKLGRKWIQVSCACLKCYYSLADYSKIQGFLLAAVFLGILAGRFDDLNHASFIVLFALLQFFFNFGANTYVIFLFKFLLRFRG